MGIGTAIRSVGERLAGTADNLAASVLVQVVSGACLAGGWANLPKLDDAEGWPLGLLLLFALTFGAGFLNTVRLVVMRTLRRAAIGKADPDKPSILLARLAGDDPSATHREALREAIRSSFGDSVELILWDEAVVLREGKDVAAQRAARDNCRLWLAQSAADLLIWGRVRGAGVMTLHFMGKAEHSSERSIALEGATLEVPTSMSQEAITLLSAMMIAEAWAFDHGKWQGEALERIVRRLQASSLEGQPKLSLARALTLALLARQRGDLVGLREAITQVRSLIENHSLEAEDILRARHVLVGALVSVVELNNNYPLAKDALALIDEFSYDDQGSQADLNRGIALSILGTGLCDASTLERAVTEFDRFLRQEDNADRDDLGKAWHNKGVAQAQLAELAGGEEGYRQACHSLEIALAYRTPHDRPMYWAKTNQCLGGVYATWGAQSRNSELLKSSIEHLDIALGHFREMRHGAYQNECKYNLACAHQALSRLERRTKHMDLAIAYASDVIDEADAERSPALFFNIKNLMGGLSADVAVAGQDYDAAVEAIEFYGEAFALLGPQDFEARIGVRKNRAHAMVIADLFGGKSPHINEAISEFRVCLREAKGLNHQSLARQIMQDLAAALEQASHGQDEKQLKEAAGLRQRSFKLLPEDASASERALEFTGLSITLARLAIIQKSANNSQAAVKALLEAKGLLEKCLDHPLAKKRWDLVCQLIVELKVNLRLTGGPVELVWVEN